MLENDDITGLERHLHDLETKVKHCEDVNYTLRELLKNTRSDNNKLEQTILANLEDFVFSNIKRLRETSLDIDQQVYLNVIETILNLLVDPYIRRIGDKHSNLSPRELEVAQLVRQGKTNKEIARNLRISKRAVEFHRDRLRHKLGLKKSGKNLRCYLASIG